MRANAPVLGMHDGNQYDVADSPFIRKVIASGKLTLLAAPSSPEEGADSSDGDQERSTEEPHATRGKTRKP